MAALLVLGAAQTVFAGAAQAAPLCIPIYNPQDPSFAYAVCVSEQVGTTSSVYVDVRDWDGAIVRVSDVYTTSSGNYLGVSGRIPAIGQVTNEITFGVDIFFNTIGSPTTWTQVCYQDASNEETGWTCVPE